MSVFVHVHCHFCLSKWTYEIGLQIFHTDFLAFTDNHWECLWLPSWFCCAYNNPKLHIGTLVTQIFIGLMTSNKLKGAWKKSEWHLIDWKILLANCFWLLCTRKENLTWGQESLRAFLHGFLLLVARIWKVNTLWLSDKLSEKRQMFFIHQGSCPSKFVLEAEDKSCCGQSWGLGRMGRGGGRGVGCDMRNIGEVPRGEIPFPYVEIFLEALIWIKPSVKWSGHCQGGIHVLFMLQCEWNKWNSVIDAYSMHITCTSGGTKSQSEIHVQV